MSDNTPDASVATSSSSRTSSGSAPNARASRRVQLFLDQQCRIGLHELQRPSGVPTPSLTQTGPAQSPQPDEQRQPASRVLAGGQREATQAGAQTVALPPSCRTCADDLISPTATPSGWLPLHSAAGEGASEASELDRSGGTLSASLANEKWLCFVNASWPCLGRAMSFAASRPPCSAPTTVERVHAHAN